MLKKRKAEGKIVSIPILYLLFIVYLIGTVFAVGMMLRHNIQMPFSPLQRSFVFGLGRCVLYYGAILLFSRMPWGVFAIPIIVWFRAFVYSIAISAFIGFGVCSWDELAALCLPAVVYLSGFLYLAALCCSLSLCRLRKRCLRNENIKEIRGGVLFAGICAVIGAATEAILSTS